MLLVFSFFCVGYKANIISTIVDLATLNANIEAGYKANIISTIVDASRALVFSSMAIKLI